MKYALVGCSIFKNEVEFLSPQITREIDFYWLPQKLHNKLSSLETSFRKK